MPQDRYINFLAAFLAEEKGATRSEAIAAWAELKEMNTPNNYSSWAQARRRNNDSSAKRKRR